MTTETHVCNHNHKSHEEKKKQVSQSNEYLYKNKLDHHIINKTN